MQVNDSTKFFCGLTSEQINHLLKFQPCQVCYEENMKYFCVDPNCRRKAIVCGECRQNNIHYDHYQHKVIFFKDFLTEGKYLCFENVLKKYEDFFNKFSVFIEQLKSILTEMENWQKKIKEGFQNMQVLFMSSGYMTIQEKILLFKNQIKQKKREKTLSLSQIFKNFEYIPPNQLYAKIKEFDKLNNFFPEFNRAQTLLDQVKLQKEFNQLFEYYKQFTANPEEIFLIDNINEDYGKKRDILTDNFKYSSAKIRTKNFKVQKNQNTDLISLKQSNFKFLSYELRELKLLSITIPLSQKTLYYLFHQIQSLITVQLGSTFQQNPLYEQKYSLSHKNLEKIVFAYDYFIQQLYLKDFFDKNKFPALKYLEFDNPFQYYNASQEKNIEIFLQQEYSNIKSFKIQRQIHEKSQKQTAQSLKQKFLQFLSKYQFQQICFKGFIFNQTQKQKYKQIMKANPNLRSSITDQNIQIDNIKSVSYAFFKYQKYKYISKRTFHSIVNHILT